MAAKETILATLKQKDCCTRADLQKLTGLPRTTITDNLAKLELKGAVESFLWPVKRRGRRSRYFTLVENGEGNF